ncbi:membrane protein [Philodulcilactobacillus myokoensis]|uniref:Membrane protein n=1 Tax=Philodulcilactobacillus myokoensis TaxID=2929573 RepID=A0A9W6ERW2_9LACO|nr:DUF1003 domain-containing protein [Philodulcilactobacillus myokoensis]GLB46581.1 membrane protein [Philodulcilactobacillus myokoensis]
MVRHKIVHCLVDGKEYPCDEGEFVKDLDSTIKNNIKRDHKNAKASDFICEQHLLGYHIERVDELIQSDFKGNMKIERRLTRALKNNDYIITDVNKQMNQNETFGEKVSDGVAKFGGSWSFIGIFVFVLLAWMIINSLSLFGLHFDKYPFILLNLFLSCVSAVQAPIIMMSQNRSADHDRMSAENDYHVNQKTEHELRILHSKIDHLTQAQMPHDLEIEKLELEIMGELRREMVELNRQNRELIERKINIDQVEGDKNNGR